MSFMKKHFGCASSNISSRKGRGEKIQNLMHKITTFLKAIKISHRKVNEFSISATISQTNHNEFSIHSDIPDLPMYKVYNKYYSGFFSKSNTINSLSFTIIESVY